MSQILSVEPKPFVKWAGGKRQLLDVIEKHLPRRFETYYEPFLGGGAVLFRMLAQNPDARCKASDLNSDLVLAYVTVRDRVDELIQSLQNHAKNYKKNPDSYYYKVREQEPKDQIEKVSRLLFLNRTCFNGLYRVNSKGKFNVPLGRYSNPNIVNEENLYAVSNILRIRKVQFSCRDFTSVLDDADRGDFVYFDPPYQPVSDTANFTSYTNRDFTYEDLQKLVKVSEKLSERGCNVLHSNSNSPEVRALFSKDWKIVAIRANRAINSDSSKRTGHTELLIKNY
ncbi:Modification methylase MjaIII [Candidatus Nitrosotenuis uzonensis]|uniref:site-specific DNA-methyltransferase (adenine-specific) n=1 Tax=Candidatus Nitrosotenuis uzonensis TaxID=1407055 RepID=V6AUK1_9ARCH|nr:Modification methylase MjaIII [Candidatus Nitrosotenuis uzonensis]